MKVTTVERFGGLQLTSDPSDVGLRGAIEAKNVILANDLSFVESRPGTAVFGASATTGDQIRRLLLDGNPAGGELLVVSISGLTLYLDRFTVGGLFTQIGSWAVLAAISDAISVGTPTTRMAFFASPGTLLRKYSGGALAASVGKPKYVAVSPTSNRLIQGHYGAAADTPSGANGNRSCVFFSDPDAPETYTATNFVHLRPGDGEELRGIVTWGERTFVFKESTVFVFGGEGVDAAGEPVFDYRPISLRGRIGIRDAQEGPRAAAGANGVYYLATDGVYRTTGGVPEKVSGALDALFQDGAMVNAHTLSAGNNRVVIHTFDTLYVLDERHGHWVTWTVPAQLDKFLTPVIGWPEASSGQPERLFWARNNQVVQTFESVATDWGAVMATSYRTGFDDLGWPGLKVIARTELRGSGAIGYTLSVDDQAAVGSESAILGVAPAITSVVIRRSIRGRKLSFTIGAPQASWKVCGVDLFEASRFPAGVKAA